MDPNYTWPPLGQAWTDLPESDPYRDGDHRRRGLGEDLPRPGHVQQAVAAGPPARCFTADAFGELNEVCDRIAQLILDACRRRARTAGELHRLLDVPEGETRLLDPDEELHEGLLAAYRPDVLFSGGVPCIVEYNIDSSLGGGFDADTVIQRYAELYRTQDLLDGARPAPSLLDQRFAAIRDTLGLPDGARVALLMDFDADYPGLDDPETFIRILSPLIDQARAVRHRPGHRPGRHRRPGRAEPPGRRRRPGGRPVPAVRAEPGHPQPRPGRGGRRARRRHAADVRQQRRLAAQQQAQLRLALGGPGPAAGGRPDADPPVRAAHRRAHRRPARPGARRTGRPGGQAGRRFGRARRADRPRR